MPAVTAEITSLATFDCAPDSCGATRSRAGVSAASGSSDSARQTLVKVCSLRAQMPSRTCAIGTATGPCARSSKDVTEPSVNLTVKRSTVTVTSTAPTLLRVTVVLACPCASVVPLVGLSVASPFVTRHCTATPGIRAPN